MIGTALSRCLSQTGQAELARELAEGLKRRARLPGLDLPLADQFGAGVVGVARDERDGVAHRAEPAVALAGSRRH